jgi:formate/nitrite transporter FocA (FNT family)
VCIATFSANSATTIPGKVLGLWPPIAAFVTIGLEHSVANFFFIPLGMALGANVSWTDFVVKNALPVTLGNFLAATLMALSYGTVFGRIFGGCTIVHI